MNTGPDGALYIADWYNPIIQHGEVDFRDPRRDHKHGRIWRVTYKGRPLAKKPKLVGQPTEDVAWKLTSGDGYTRHFAKRELRQRGLEEAKKGIEPIKKGSPLRAIDRLEILWAYQSMNHLDEGILRMLLESDDHRIRAAAHQLFGGTPGFRVRRQHPVGGAERAGDRLG